MVEVGAAFAGVKDTALISLEDHLVGLDGDSEGLGLEGGLHLGGVVGGDSLEALDGDGGGAGSVILAALLSAAARDVGVDGLELGLVGAAEKVTLVVLVGVLLETTVAAHVVVAVGEVGAVNELLLREGEELTGGNLVGTLERAGGREGPAGAALALVLHGGDGTLVDPIEGSLGGLGEDLGLSGERVVLDATKDGLVLGLGPVGELVVAGAPAGARLVVLVDPVVGVGEVLEAHVELLDGLEDAVVGSDVAKVVEVDGGHFDDVTRILIIIKPRLPLTT